MVTSTQDVSPTQFVETTDNSTHLSGAKAAYDHGSLMLNMLVRSATAPTHGTHHHGEGHDRLIATSAPNTVCIHHSTFPLANRNQ